MTAMPSFTLFLIPVQRYGLSLRVARGKRCGL